MPWNGLALAMYPSLSYSLPDHILTISSPTLLSLRHLTLHPCNLFLSICVWKHGEADMPNLGKGLLISRAYLSSPW
jgi:hypothetical protein